MHVFHKDALCWFLIVLSVKSARGQWFQSPISEFKEGRLEGMSGTCLEGRPFAVKKYEDFVSVFKKPDGANEYFATSWEVNKKYCMQSSIPFIGDVGNEVHVFLTTNIDGADMLNFSVIDIYSLETLTNAHETTDVNNWTDKMIKLTNRSAYRVSYCYFIYYHLFSKFQV